MNERTFATARRTFLAGSAAALAAGFVYPRAVAAQSGGPRRIDVHNHLIPPPYLAAGRPQITAGSDTDPAPVLNWNPAHAIEEMDRSGVAVAMLSMSTPGISTLGGGPAQWRKLARACNEYAASLLRDFPGRFGNFAALPLPDVEGSLAEAIYALDVLKADGIGLLTSYGNTYPGDASFRPLFAELNRRKAVVFVHPTAPQCCSTLLPGIAASLDEFMFDVTRAITSLLFGGTFAMFPDIRFIFTHAGGTMTPISARINAYGARHHEYDAANPHGVYYELKKLHYDIANSTNASAMAALMNLVPTSQILFGSDTPYVPIVATATGFDKMTLPDDLRLAINRGNALQLFPRLAD
jgi:predicted TIM-barrel fold metal-dependent hydrolase